MTPEHDVLCTMREYAVLAHGRWIGCDCALIETVTERTIHQMIRENERDDR